MNILTIITAFSFVGAFHITAKVGQPKSTKTIRMIRSDSLLAAVKIVDYC